jgi:hypothetical protein
VRSIYKGPDFAESGITKHVLVARFFFKFCNGTFLREVKVRKDKGKKELGKGMGHEFGGRG